MPETPHVAAVVVTYNRLDKLRTGIAALRASEVRPQTIVVVDNASTDGTGEYVSALASDDDIDVVSLRENTGGAGGFAAGLSRAHQMGADFMWIMDDDCYPEPQALGRLLDGHAGAERLADDRVPFACSIVKFPDGNLCEMNEAVTTWDWPRFLVHGLQAVQITECTFVSVLLPRWSIQEFGLPLAEYFIWFDDKEYTKRLTRNARPGIQVLDSHVVHDMPENKGVDYERINDQNAWKFKLGIRNQSSYRWHFEGKLSWISYVRTVTVAMRRGKVPRRLRAQIRREILAGTRFNPQPRFPDPIRRS